MRLVIARCTAEYSGRLSSRLEEAIRLLLVKADGSVLIHSDGGSYKPLNWMSPPCSLQDKGDTWIVTNKYGEELTIQLLEVHHDSNHELGEDSGLIKDGVEAQ